MNIVANFFDWTLPIAINVILFYILVYGPFIIIPVGLILIARLFLVKGQTRGQAVIAVSTVSVGVVLAVVALALHASGNL